MSSFSAQGRRGGSPRRRQSRKRRVCGGSAANPRDKASRFAFLSTLLLAYSGATLGLFLLWNSGSSGGALETPPPVEGGGGGGGGAGAGSVIHQNSADMVVLPEEGTISPHGPTAVESLSDEAPAAAAKGSAYQESERRRQQQQLPLLPVTRSDGGVVQDGDIRGGRRPSPAGEGGALDRSGAGAAAGRLDDANLTEEVGSKQVREDKQTPRVTDG